ncbi:hypothetical protein RIF29_21029 [Crotalaria pallida]|uniref:Uncharacterized protein n=1 Tax=Crotalaria pallida TaxID=3830 RepID=A0AAN9ID07_CROPI
MKRIFLMINCILSAIGVTGAPLVMRLYYIHGGSRVWLPGLLQAAGFPIILIPLSISFIIRRRTITDTSKLNMLISAEAKHFGLGEATYYIVLVVSAIVCQINMLGVIGVIFCSSSLLSGIVIALMVPVTEVFAVIFYKEIFKADKRVSVALSIWGFVSYFYGELKQAKKMENNIPMDDELPHKHIVPNPKL